MQVVGFGHGQLSGPVPKLLQVQRGVEPPSRPDVVGENGAEVTGLILGVTNFSAGMGVIPSAAGASLRIQKSEEDFAKIVVICPVKPGLVDVGLGSNPALRGQAGPFYRHSGCGIKVE